MRHFRRADAEGQRAQRAVRRGVAVAAHQGHAGLADALLRADDMDDALTLVAEIEQGDAALRCVVADLARPAGGDRDRGCPAPTGCRSARSDRAWQSRDRAAAASGRARAGAQSPPRSRHASGDGRRRAACSRRRDPRRRGAARSSRTSSAGRSVMARLLRGGFDDVAEGGAAVVPVGGAEAGEGLGRASRLYQGGCLPLVASRRPGAGRRPR